MALSPEIRGVIEAAVRAVARGLTTQAAERERVACAFVQVDGLRGSVCMVLPEPLATVELAQALATQLEVQAAEAKLPLTVFWSGLYGGAPTDPELVFQVGPVGRAMARLDPAQPPQVHITHTLSEVQRLSEQEVLAIGSDMTRISQLARHHSDGLKEVSAQLSGDDGAGASSSMATTIKALENDLKQFTQGLIDRTNHQAQDVAQARAWTTDIMRLGQAIADIAASARILTFNARIESARIGEAGKGFAVIAQSIQELATQIRATNDSVSKLAHNLASALPRLGANATGIADEARKAMKTLEGRVEQVQASLVETRAKTAKAIDQGAADASELEAHTFAVLEHLQFQDRVAQMMADALGQVKQLLAYAQVSEESQEVARIEQVGKIGRELETSGALRAGGDVELF